MHQSSAGSTTNVVMLWLQPSLNPAGPVLTQTDATNHEDISGPVGQICTVDIYITNLLQLSDISDTCLPPEVDLRPLIIISCFICLVLYYLISILHHCHCLPLFSLSSTLSCLLTMCYIMLNIPLTSSGTSSTVQRRLVSVCNSS